MASATSMTDIPGTSATPEQIRAHFELGVSLTLSFWPALTLAVQNNWGGPSSADKRDWFAGALISLFDERPDTDAEDVETVCLQVMMDEFEVNVEDDSAYDVAEQIMRMRKDCERGNFAEVRELKRRWDEKGGKVDLSALQVEDHGEQGETDGSDDEEDEDDEDEEMGDAPPPAPKEKPLPQIDEDGFETVVSKKRR